MNRISFLFLALVFITLPITMQAQELTIKYFEETYEITASQYPRKDFNGEACALIKVEVMDAITKVEGGEVGDVVDKGNEKWVYIIANQKVFKLHFANHLSVRINTTDYGVQLKGNVTYILRLISDANNAHSTTVPSKQQETSTHSSTDTNNMSLIDLFRLGQQYYKASREKGITPQKKAEYVQAGIETFRKVLEQRPDYYKAQMMIARLSITDGTKPEENVKNHYEQALVMMEGKENTDTARIEAYSYLGFYYVQTDDNDKARIYCDKILKLDSQNKMAIQIDKFLKSIGK